MAIGVAVFAVALAFVVSFLLTRLLAHPRSRLAILDLPNERSLHRVPVPRTGGIAIVTALAVGAGAGRLAAGSGAFPLLPVLAALLVAVVSFIDDRSGMPVSLRLAAHFVAAALLLVGGLIPETFDAPGWSWGWPVGGAAVICALFIVWMTNLYNFMDGMDGFAGGMAVLGFTAFATLGGMAGNVAFTVLALVVAAAAAGFLVSNFPPARIFMGDTGSSMLGLLAGGFMLWAARDRVFTPWVGLLIFSPFIVDASVTLLRRVVRRDKIWVAHKTHYYQRLVEHGWGHRKTVLAEYALMLLCAVSAVWGSTRAAAVQWGVILFWVVAYTVLAWVIERCDRRNVTKAPDA